MTDHMPAWGNGRAEFREPFDQKKPKKAAVEEGPAYPESLDFGDEREKQMVWETYTQLGKISFNLKYTNAKEETTDRTVTPLALTINNGNWGFFAVCETRNAVRWFRFDRVEGIDPLPAVRHLTQWEASSRLLALASHERQSILDALQILDPVLWDKLKRGDYKRPAKKAKAKDRNYSYKTKKEAHEEVAKETYRNREGLTWVEWARAATVPIADGGTLEHRDAWKAGEDPTEWRAHLENERPKKRGKRKVSRNSAGMAWGEWAHQAGVSRTQYTSPERKGWMDGVDPDEFREKHKSLRERMKDEQRKRGSLTQMGRKRRLS